MRGWVGSTAGGRLHQHLHFLGIVATHRLSLGQANVMVGGVPEEVLVLNVVLRGYHKIQSAT